MLRKNYGENTNFTWATLLSASVYKYAAIWPSSLVYVLKHFAKITKSSEAKLGENLFDIAIPQIEQSKERENGVRFRKPSILGFPAYSLVVKKFYIYADSLIKFYICEVLYLCWFWIDQISNIPVCFVKQETETGSQTYDGAAKALFSIYFAYIKWNGIILYFDNLYFYYRRFICQ